MSIRMAEQMMSLPVNMAKPQLGSGEEFVDFSPELETVELGAGNFETPPVSGFTQIGKIVQELIHTDTSTDAPAEESQDVEVFGLGRPIRDGSRAEQAVTKGAAPAADFQLDDLPPVKAGSPLNSAAEVTIPQPNPENNRVSLPDIANKPDNMVSQAPLRKNIAASEPELVLPNTGAARPKKVDGPSIVSPSSDASKLPDHARFSLERRVVTAPTTFHVQTSRTDPPEGSGEITETSLGKTIFPERASAGTPTNLQAATKTPAHENKVLVQITTAISKTSKDSFEIRLDPPELGRVTIAITQSDSGMSALVTSEKADITDMLRRHSEILARELTKFGFSEASLEFANNKNHSNDDVRDDQTFNLSTDATEQADPDSAAPMSGQTSTRGLDIRL